MAEYPPPLRADDGTLLCPCDEWLDGIYRTTCRRVLDAQGRCGKHWGYRIPDSPSGDTP